MTQEQKLMLEYNDKQIANYDNIQLAKTITEKDMYKRLDKNKLFEKFKQKHKLESNAIFINHMQKWISKEDLSDDIIAQEQEFYRYI